MKRITKNTSLGSIVGEMEYDSSRVRTRVMSIASVRHGAMVDLAINIYQSTRTRLTEAK